MADHILSAIKEIAASLATALGKKIGDLDTVLQEAGLTDTGYVIYILIGVVGLMLLFRLLKASFGVLQKVVLPAALIAWAAGNYFSVPFFAVFPALVGVGAAWMLVRG